MYAKHIKLGWESGEKGFTTGLVTSLLCDLPWVTPSFFYRCYLLLYTICSLKERPGVGSRKGLGYLKHHLPERNPWQPAPEETQGQAQKQGWRVPDGTAVLLLRSGAHTFWFISCVLAQEETQPLLDQALWGSCARFVCSPGQGEPSLSRDLVVTWEDRRETTGGFFVRANRYWYVTYRSN